ncbi:hypothetical protein C8U37_107168 [Trichococcus patagoniensis]|uniref:Uncharacterized protein n=1 Tax=Trichococcus patagoniensis TaxID=382641 RepID=A0A2T5ILY0_9LACT|nr:hypothetical protein [Trichococcus patagoniensis]PTQ84800.1 hypothetical protein C8U37_107168 [Trichococcus patagoniensis]
MDTIYNLIIELINNDLLNKSEIVSRYNLSYTQSFYFVISSDMLEGYRNGLALFPDQVLVNGYRIDDDPEIELSNDIQISITNNFFSDDFCQFNNFIFYDQNNFLKFSEIFFNEVKISHLEKIKKKAKVQFLIDTNINLENSIFTDTNNKDELSVPEILLKDEYYLSIKAISLPNIVPDILLESLINRKIESQFELLSNHFINNETYIINSDKTVSFNIKEIDYSFELTKDLDKVIRFIFDDERHYYDKLEIFKNIFSLSLLKMGRLGKDLSAALLDDIKSQYSLYMSDNLDKFIKDKQVITEKYMSFMQSVTAKTKTIYDEIQKQMLTLIGIILTTFFIKGIEEGISNVIPPLLGLLYSSFSIYLKHKSGWNEDSDFFIKEIDFMDKTYGNLYKFDFDYTDELYNNYIKPQLIKLEIVENRLKKIYLLFFLLFSLWFLAA